MNSILINQNLRFFLLLLLLTILLSGCLGQFAGVRTSTTNQSGGVDINQARSIAYNGPKARVAVARFTDKTRVGWYSRAKGNGMADQLATALVNTGRYIVLERQNFDALIEEQSLGQSGLVRRGTAARMHRIEGAELLVVAAVTEFEANSGGAGGGIGGYRRTSKKGVLGGMAGGVRYAHIGIDLRLIDAETSRILAATSVEGRSTDIGLGGFIGGYTGHGGLGGALGLWENTPLEKALRLVINKAVDFIVSKTPEVYYRHGTSSSYRSSRVTRANSKWRNTVRSMQRKLNEIGYASGPVDGLWGPKTQKAVSTFQSDYGLSVTGKLDQATIQAIQKTN